MGKEWYAPKASQHMFDPYSFCLLVLGLIFHLLWGTDDIDNWVYGFLLAIGLELVWEIIGHSKYPRGPAILCTGLHSRHTLRCRGVLVAQCCRHPSHSGHLGDLHERQL